MDGYVPWEGGRKLLCLPVECGYRDPGVISSVCDKRSEPGAVNTSLGSFVSQQSYKQTVSLICIDGVICIGWD